MSQPPPNIRRTSSRVYDIHNPDDLNELARKLSRRRSRRSTGASQHPYTPGLGETQYGFPQSTQQGAYVSEPGQYGDASNVALATPLGVPRLKSYDQSREGDEYAGGEELAPSTSRRSRASQRPREESVREDDEEASGSDDDDDSKSVCVSDEMLNTCSFSHLVTFSGNRRSPRSDLRRKRNGRSSTRQGKPRNLLGRPDCLRQGRWRDLLQDAWQFAGSVIASWTSIQQESKGGEEREENAD